LKPLPDESFESWAHRVERYEYGRALMRLAQGDDPAEVMTETSQRIMNKLKHPVLKAIHDAVSSEYTPDRSLDQYKKNYLNRVGLKADHIRDN
jgi:glutamyl-tRNA reductase